MPELPDLQVISSNLSKRFSGKCLIRLTIFKDKKLNAPQELYKQSFENYILLKIVREGKELHFHFENGNILGLHLMLKGEIFPIGEIKHINSELFPKQSEDIKFKIIELIFDDGTGLVLTDLMAQAKPILHPFISSVPDALSEKFSEEYLDEKLQEAGSTKIKTLLINQDIVRGIGNAYADEILWHCSISPFSICSKIPKSKITEIIVNTKKVLIDAEQNIRKIAPDIISGEVRDFLIVHTTKHHFTPDGQKIIIEELNNKKTYFTQAQILYE